MEPDNFLSKANSERATTKKDFLLDDTILTHKSCCFGLGNTMMWCHDAASDPNHSQKLLFQTSQCNAASDTKDVKDATKGPGI